MIFAHRARTSLALGAAGATVLAALLLAPGVRSTVTTDCELPGADGILTARLASTKVAPGEQHVAVTIQMPDVGKRVRPPLSLAIVIDRSGSMEGEPLANAKAAAARLVDELATGDAFTVVTYSSTDEIVMPMVRATADNKAMARTKIMGIWDDGNTCISCGITRGAAQLQESPLRSGIRRMVLISDGQANTGLYDRGELAQLATETAARGMSISTVGVGLDFDEVTMTTLANVGHGNYYFVEDTAKLGEMFARELSGLGTTVATDARLVIDAASGIHIDEAYGFELLRQGSRVVVSLPDLRADKTLTVVLRTSVPSSPGHFDLGTLELHWRSVADGSAGLARAPISTFITTDAAAVTASIDATAMTAIEKARTAKVLEDATTIYERDGYEAAQRVLDRHRSNIRMNKNIAAPTVQAIESKTEDAIVNFRKAAPAKAKKAARADAYDLAH